MTMRFGLREVLFLALLVAIPVCAWWLVFRPRSQEMTLARQEINAKRVKLQALSRTSVRMDQLKAEIAENGRAIEFFQSKLPPEKEMDKVLVEIWQLAKQNNLIVKDFKTNRRGRQIQLTSATGPYAEQPITLKLKGDFNDGLYSFLLALEQRPRITRIHSMTIEKDKDSKSGRVNATVDMAIFFERKSREES